MSGSPWLVVGLVLIVIVVIAWPIGVLLASRGRQHGGRGEAPKDHWISGGMFRGGPRAVSRRDEVPAQSEIADPGELGPDDVLPPEPAEMEKRREQQGRSQPASNADANNGG